MDATYRAAGEHTHVPSAISAAHYIAAIIMTLVEYKWLAPIAQNKDEGGNSTAEESDEEIELGTVTSGAVMYKRLKCVETEECIDDSSLNNNLDTNLDGVVPLVYMQ